VIFKTQPQRRPDSGTLRAFGLRQQLNQAEVAERISVATDIYRAYEAGRSQPETVDALLLARALETEPADLFRGWCDVSPVPGPAPAEYSPGPAPARGVAEEPEPREPADLEERRVLERVSAAAAAGRDDALAKLAPEDRQLVLELLGLVERILRKVG